MGDHDNNIMTIDDGDDDEGVDYERFYNILIPRLESLKYNMSQYHDM